MRRYYALLLGRDGTDAGHAKVRLIKVMDGDAVLAETDLS